MADKNSNKKIIILYGYAGNEETHWQTWLAHKCQSLGYDVCYPQFPNPDNPELSAWIEHLDLILPVLDENSIIVGHSLGCAVAFRLLEKVSVKKIKKLILVAPTNWSALKNTELKFLKPFYENFDFERVRTKTANIEIYIADDDPYIDSAEALDWQKQLQAKTFVIKNGGHLNVASGFTSFPEVLNSILE